MGAAKWRMNSWHLDERLATAKTAKGTEEDFKGYFAVVAVDESHQEFKSGTLTMGMRTLAVMPPT